jgi:hypothetical protein
MKKLHKVTTSFLKNTSCSKNHALQDKHFNRKCGFTT